MSSRRGKLASDDLSLCRLEPGGSPQPMGRLEKRSLPPRGALKLAHIRLRVVRFLKKMRSAVVRPARGGTRSRNPSTSPLTMVAVKPDGSRDNSQV